MKITVIHSAAGPAVDIMESNNMKKKVTETNYYQIKQEIKKELDSGGTVKSASRHTQTPHSERTFYKIHKTNSWEEYTQKHQASHKHPLERGKLILNKKTKKLSKPGISKIIKYFQRRKCELCQAPVSSICNNCQHQIANHVTQKKEEVNQ